MMFIVTLSKLWTVSIIAAKYLGFQEAGLLRFFSVMLSLGLIIMGYVLGLCEHYMSFWGTQGIYDTCSCYTMEHELNISLSITEKWTLTI